MLRKNERPTNSMRPITIELDPVEYAEGSCLISYGKTKVICTASVETQVPKWLQGSQSGWVSAEYSMLPRSTHTRIRRDKAFQGGRSQEISRLIGRALRSAVNLKKIPELSITVDCDVLQADGGTRTASISGGFVALAKALEFLKLQEQISEDPLNYQVAALSAGYKSNNLLVDLDYEEDSSCDSDINFVFSSTGTLIEVQGTAESAPFSFSQLNEVTEKTFAESKKIFDAQVTALKWEKTND